LFDENFGQIDSVIEQVLKDQGRSVYEYDGKSLKRSVAGA